ncbi:hypothetical protein [uncultured Pseudoalteromonas sp.]|uniref:hypothetical protein n=1 Tax=uncultured Pseudoalteromonas sp. TaxID=114053 RepID=UPI0030C7A45E
MKKLSNEDQKKLRSLLGDYCDQFKVVAAIPTRYSKIEGVTEKKAGAIEYISFIAYPEIDKEDNRKAFSDALLQAVLKSQNSLNELHKNFESPKEWPRIESCIRKGKKRYYKACVFWQAYTHFCNYVNQAERNESAINYGWHDFLIKYASFYQTYDDGFGFGGSKLDFQELYSNRLNFPNIKNHGDKEDIRPLRKHWSELKSSLNLVYGLVKAFEKEGVKSLPILNTLISNPFWVDDAIKSSQYKLAKYLLVMDKPQSYIKTDINPLQMPFLDLSFDPIFVRSEKIFQ